MDPIMAVARRYGLKVIEDVSHAQGGLYQGQKLGTFGDVAAFSLQTSKLCPAGEGGVLITRDESLLRRATALGHYERLGRRPATATGHEEGSDEDEYDRFRIPPGYRISPLHAPGEWWPWQAGRAQPARKRRALPARWLSEIPA
jgi:dTDP-4-amino-4,6-dideoxygalactose transaminase